MNKEKNSIKKDYSTQNKIKLMEKKLEVKKKFDNI